MAQMAIGSLRDMRGHAQRGDTTPNHPQADTRKNVGGQHQDPTLLPPGKRHDAHCKGKWMIGLDRTEHLATPEFDPWTVQLIASFYTEYDIPAVDLQPKTT